MGEEVDAGLEETFGGTVGVVTGTRGVSEALLSCSFRGTSVESLDLGTGDGVESFSKDVSCKRSVIFGEDVLLSKFGEAVEVAFETAGDVEAVDAVGCFLAR